MDQKHFKLWERIQDFCFDSADTKLTFAARLARENKWSLRFSELVIEEYKRFTYLTCVSDHPVTPSDEVDQVWHLHLTYTRNYWDVFCADVLRKPLHHDPTQGGSDEDKKYERLYEQTLALYEKEFGYMPPADIWPPSEARFATAVNMKRVDISENWLIPKRIFSLPTRIALLSTASLTLAGCTVFGVELTPKQAIVGGLLIAFFLIVFFFIIKANGKNSGGCGGGCSSGSDGGSGCGSGCGGGGCGGGG